MVMDTQPLEMGQKRARRLISAPRFPQNNFANSVQYSIKFC